MPGCIPRPVPPDYPETTCRMEDSFDDSSTGSYNLPKFLRIFSLSASLHFRVRFPARTRSGKLGETDFFERRLRAKPPRKPKEFLISMNRMLSLVCVLASGMGVVAVAQAAAPAKPDPAPSAPVSVTGATKIAIIHRVSEWTICKIARVEDIRRKRGPASLAHPLHKRETV